MEGSGTWKAGAGMWDAAWWGPLGGMDRQQATRAPEKEDARENGTLLLRTSYFLGALPRFDMHFVFLG